MCHPERSRGILCLRSESRASAGDSSTVFAARNDTRRGAFPCVIPSEVEGSPAYGASLVLRQGIPRPSSRLGMTPVAEHFRVSSRAKSRDPLPTERVSCFGRGFLDRLRGSE